MFWKVDADSARIRVPPPVIYATFFAGGLLLDRLFGWRLPLPDPVRFGLAAGAVAVSGLILLAALARFLRARTSPEPWKTTRVIIDRGLYAHSRNPMYLGMALLYAGGAAFARSPGALALLVPAVAVIQTQVIAREERYLEAKFGEAYRAYKARVRRWL